jgi:4-hydroxy-2-oxoheptanedioate aldolase
MDPYRLKTLWHHGETILNAWLTIPSSWTAELLAHLGYHALTIDMQHGPADYQTALSMLQAISTTDAIPLVRLPWNDPAIIGRLLDSGAMGVICPMVNTRQQAESFVGACRYTPQGYRSYGPFRAAVVAGEDYLQHANEFVLTLAMIETEEAMRNLDAIVSTPGLDGVYVGPADLSISLGLPGVADFSDPALIHALQLVLNACKKHDRLPGVQANTPQASLQLERMGYRFITPIHDSPLLRQAALEALRVAQGKGSDSRQVPVANPSDLA